MGFLSECKALDVRPRDLAHNFGPVGLAEDIEALRVVGLGGPAQQTSHEKETSASHFRRDAERQSRHEKTVHPVTRPSQGTATALRGYREDAYPW